MYFLISDELIERNDLGIYEKMALIVLAKYSNSSQKISRELLVEKMGAGKVEFGYEYTDIAIKRLIKHGLLTIANSEDLETLELKPFSENRTDEFSKGLVNDIGSDEFEKEEDVRAEEFEEDGVSGSEKLRRIIEEKASEFSKVRKNKIVDLSVKENMEALESKHGIPTEEIKFIFDEVCTNQKAKILYNLANRDIQWLKDAYDIVQSGENRDKLEVLAEFLQQNTKSEYSIKSKNKKDDRVQKQDGLDEQNFEYRRTSDFFQPSERIEHSQLSEPVSNSDLDFYNGYDLKSIFANLERKFEYKSGSEKNEIQKEELVALKGNESQEKVLENKVEYDQEMKSNLKVQREDTSGKLNMRTTSFSRAKNMYNTYGNSNLSKKSEKRTENGTKK